MIANTIADGNVRTVRAKDGTPVFSIVSVCRNDAWSLAKTARSVFRQSFRDFEYLIVDGASTDGTDGLIEFWQSQGLVHRAVSEPDTGVYNAMNKALRLARGEFVCFLNAGDSFAGDDALARVSALLTDEEGLDGVLGWGELNGQIWASWIEHPAFKLASLGFCHQALFVRRSWLEKYPFDERPFKTDSDTLQLARLYEAGATIRVLPEVLAVRGGEPGISADLERTRLSIRNTLVEEYPGLDEATADQIIAFRRRFEGPEAIIAKLTAAEGPLRTHLACMVLDTLFLRQSATIPPALAEDLFVRASAAVAKDHTSARAVDRLLLSQDIRASLLKERADRAAALKQETATFDEQEERRLVKLRAQRAAPARQDFVVSFTSFPARLSSLHLVVQSLVEQTCPPREIRLWLGQDEVPNRSWLPRQLLQFEDRGLKVHFARRTFHQYDKFMHSGDADRELPFVIVDDDVIYPPDAMEQLLRMHREFPHAVIANRCHLLPVRAGGTIGPYQEWQREVQFLRPSLRAFPTGAGGVLYPPGFIFAPSVRDARAALAHAPYADDVWLKVNALAIGMPAMSTPLSQGSKWYLRYTPTMRAGALHATNVDLGLNDMQMNRSLEWLSRVRPQWRDELEAEAPP